MTWLLRISRDFYVLFRHYKIFCVNVKYGIQYEFRIFLFNRFAK